MNTHPIRSLLFAATCSLATSASAVVVTLNPTADAFVTSGSADPNAGFPNYNYGAAGALMVSAPGSAKGEMQSLLKFNLASAKSAFDTAFGAGNWLANDNWAEGTGTPTSNTIPSNPPVDGVTFASLDSLESGADTTLGTFTYTPVGNTNPPGIPPASYTLNLDASFLADVSAGNDVSLRAYAGDAGVSYLFNSHNMGSNKPVLSVSAIAAPEPRAAMLLAGAALPVLWGRRRHARAA